MYGTVGRRNSLVGLVWHFGFQPTSVCTRTWKRQTSAESHGAFSHYVHTGHLAEKVCTLSLSHCGAIWHISVPKGRREVEKKRKNAPLDTPTLLFVCRSKHAAIETRSRGRDFATGSILRVDVQLLWSSCFTIWYIKKKCLNKLPLWLKAS